MMQRIHFNGISKCVLLSLLCFSLSLFYFYSFAFFILSFCLCVSSVSVPTLLRVCVMHWNTETHIHAEHVLPAILQIPEKAAGVCSRGYSVAWVMAMSVCVTSYNGQTLPSPAVSQKIAYCHRDSMGYQEFSLSLACVRSPEKPGMVTSQR